MAQIQAMRERTKELDCRPCTSKKANLVERLVLHLAVRQFSQFGLGELGVDYFLVNRAVAPVESA